MEEYIIVFHSLEQIHDFIHWAKQIPYDLDISYDSIIVDGKSILGVTMIGLEKKLCLKIHGNLTEQDKEHVKLFFQ